MNKEKYKKKHAWQDGTLSIRGEVQFFLKRMYICIDISGIEKDFYKSKKILKFSSKKIKKMQLYFKFSGVIGVQNWSSSWSRRSIFCFIYFFLFQPNSQIQMIGLRRHLAQKECRFSAWYFCRFKR